MEVGRVGCLAWVLLVASVVLASRSVPAQESPEEVFTKGENAFKFQDYAAAERLLRPLLHPKILLKDPLEIKKAREYLGACYYWLKDYERM